MRVNSNGLLTDFMKIRLNLEKDRKVIRKNSLRRLLPAETPPRVNPSSSSSLASSYYGMFVVSSGVSGVRVRAVFSFLNSGDHKMTADELFDRL